MPGNARATQLKALFGVFLALPAVAADVDPRLLGRWWGTTGTERERIDVGFEFSRGADGKLMTRITQPIMNYYGQAAGEAQWDGERLSNATLKLSLALDGDALRGHYPGPNSEIELKRVDKLPSEPTPPRLPAGPEPRWQTRLGGQIFASPIVADGVAYVGSTAGVFNAVDARDGKLRWAYATGAAIHGAAAVTGDAVYFADDGGTLHRLDRSNGKPQWRRTLHAPVPRVLPHPQVFDWDWQGAQPLVVDGIVYIGGGDGRMHAIDAASGEPRWSFATGGKIRSGAALDGERVVFGSEDHFVYALDRHSGQLAWRFDTGAAVDATPVVHEGRVFVGNRGYGLHALSAETGELAWKLFFWGSWVESTPVVVDGTLYIGSSDLRRVSAIDPADGRVLWRSDVFGWTWGTPLVIDDRIYVAAAGGAPYFIRHVASLASLDRKTGRMLTRRPLPDTGGHQWGVAGSIARAGDTLIVASIEGALYGFPL